MQRGVYYGEYNNLQRPYRQRDQTGMRGTLWPTGYDPDINVFLRQSLHTGGLPFEVKMPRPNQETIAAMLEAERIIYDPNVKRYTDVEEALRELKK